MGDCERGEERDNLNICIDCISFRVLFAFFEQIFECRVKFNSCCHKEISQTAGETGEGRGKGEERQGKILWIVEVYCYYKRFSKIINRKCASSDGLSQAEITREQKANATGKLKGGGGKDTGHWDTGTTGTAGPKAIVHFVNGN